MLKITTYTIVLGAGLILASCSESADTTEDFDVQETISQGDSDISSEAPVETENQTTEEVQTPDYAGDWEKFKTAVINQDLKAVSAFIGDNEKGVDINMMLEAFADPDFQKQLKDASFEDLEMEQEGDMNLWVFSSLVEGDDGEGNTFESGLYLYLTEQDHGLMLEDFLAAG